MKAGMDIDVLQMPVRELVSQTQRGELSAEAIASIFIEQAHAQAQVCAWQHFDPAAVLGEARAVDARGRAGPLAGVPIGVKDLMDTADMPTTYGSPIYAGHRPERDAACVALGRRLGAIVMGKTVTTEFAAFQSGPTRNPRSPGGLTHTPGGSSSGSAAAVAAGMVPVAFGTQTAGSIVRPAAFCGVVGYKPTIGMVSGVGVKALAPSLDTVGALARRVDDVAYFIGALTRCSLDPQPIHGLRVGICRTPYWDWADDDTRRVFEDAIRLFERAGADVADVSLPREFRGLNEAQIAIMGYEAVAAFATEPASAVSGFSRSFEDLLDKGRLVTGEAYREARRFASASRQILGQVFKPFDVLLAPSTIGEAPQGLEATGDPVFNRMWSLLGNPCVHVPIGAGATGMPVGITVVGPLYEDIRAISAAWMLECVAPGTRRAGE